MKLIGLLIVFGIGFYIYSLSAQQRAAADLCEQNPAGSRIVSLTKLERSYGLKLMGPMDIKDKPGTQRAIFCAALTMCDTSCTLEIQDGRVTRSDYSKL